MKVQKHFFDQINNELKAYLLGFLFADGSISEGRDNRQLRLVVSIQEDDKIINELLRDNIAPFNNVNTYHSPSKKAKGEKPLSVFSISSDELCNRLIELGCNINKSKIGINFPDLHPKAIRHFIRGYYDGNGGITLRNRKYTYQRKTTYTLQRKPKLEVIRPSVFFCSTDLKFLHYIQEYLFLQSSRGYIVSKQSKNLITYTLCYDTYSDVIDILNYLYKDCKYKLDRKYNKFDMLIKSQAGDTSSEGLTTT